MTKKAYTSVGYWNQPRLLCLLARSFLALLDPNQGWTQPLSDALIVTGVTKKASPQGRMRGRV